MTGTGVDELWHFENRQRKVLFEEGEIRDFLAELGRDLAGGEEFFGGRSVG